MSRFIRHIEDWLKNGSFRLLIVAGFILLMWGAFSPISTLIWWFSQSKENIGVPRYRKNEIAGQVPTTSSSSSVNCYIVFLPGVGDYSADQLTDGEEWFLEQLVQQHPGCVAVEDVFPYSVANKDLAEERFTEPLWRISEQADGWFKEADVLIKIRNLWRFAISVDSRYGPIYNRGIADTIIRRMRAAHPFSLPIEEPFKVILIGTSGGAQVALGAAPYLDKWLDDPTLYVVSAGGDFSGEAEFAAADHVYHLRGENDWIEDVSGILFPSRWRWVVGSPFNQARQQNRFTVVTTGPHNHTGDKGYFGLAIAKGKDTTYAELTLQKVNNLPIWSDSLSD